MCATHVHMFVVPAGHLDELQVLDRQADEARDQDRPDRFYRINQVLLRAAQVSVASVILDREEYKHPAGSLWIWMEERFRGGKENLVIDAGEFEVIRDGLSTPRGDDLKQWADEHIDGYGDVDRAVLIEVFEALVEMVRSVPPGPHGLVYGYFFTDELEPPAPAPEPDPPRPISEQEKKWLAESWDRRMHRLFVRAHMDYWPEEEGTEGRYILGLLPHERVAVLRPGFQTAWRMMFEQGHTEGYALLHELIPQLEHDLVQPLIVTRAGSVSAHYWFKIETNWSESNYGIPATPELAHDLWQRLDTLEAEHGGTDGLIENVWEMEKHWSRNTVRQAYEQVRDLLRRAMDRALGFAWLLDRDW